MKLTSFDGSCACSGAGLQRVSLATVSSIAKVSTDASHRRVVAIELRPGQEFASFVAREQSASYTQQVVCQDAGMLIRHRLGMTLDGIDPTALLAVERLIGAAQREGLVAVVETLQGHRFVVGYSVRLGLEQPLRIGALESSTGAKRSHIAGSAVVLESFDTCVAMPFE